MIGYLFGFGVFYFWCVFLCVVQGRVKRALGLAAVPILAYLFFGPK